MRLVVGRTKKLGGTVTAPPSKSHTHRAIVIASLAEGTSLIRNPSNCDDCLATAEACKKTGAGIDGRDVLTVRGVDGKPGRSDTEINAGGSGTTMRLMSGAFALSEGATTLTGNAQILKRPMQPLLDSLTELGAKRAKSLGGNGRPPICVGGKMSGGCTTLDGQSSQFASALLVACPLAENDSEITVRNMNSRPYAVMTLEHIGRAGARVYERNLEHFFIPGGQKYAAFDYTVPGDWSSAAGIIAAGMLTDSDIKVQGLDSNDVQGDKILPEYFEGMLSGIVTEIDLRDHPDLLPLLAVLGCHAAKAVTLRNVPHARVKESDRISAITSELRKMGADIEERPDGILVRPSKLKGAEMEGHEDHRIVMALAVAGLAAEGRTIINGADAVSKSYPGFVSDMTSLGADMKAVDG